MKNTPIGKSITKMEEHFKETLKNTFKHAQRINLPTMKSCSATCIAGKKWPFNGVRFTFRQGGGVNFPTKYFRDAFLKR